MEVAVAPVPGYMRHEHTQFIVWGLFADWLILAGRYRFIAKRWYDIHMYGLIGVLVISAVFRENNNKYKRIPGFNHQFMIEIHKFVAGPTLLIGIGLFVVGLFLRQLIVSQKELKYHRLLTLANVRKLHFAGGLFMWVSIRASLLSGTYVFCQVYDSYLFTLIIIETLIFASVLLYLERHYSSTFDVGRVIMTLTDSFNYDPIAEEVISKLRDSSTTCHQLRRQFPHARVLLYMNKVYNLDSSFTHPGGEWILKECAFQEVSRYLHGVIGMESRGTAAWGHSSNAFSQLEKHCIGDISLSFPDSAKVCLLRTQDRRVAHTRDLWRLMHISKISEDTCLFRFSQSQGYQMRLGMPGIRWMGKHFALSGNKGVVRLYSICTALTPEYTKYLMDMMEFYHEQAANPNQDVKLPIHPETVDYIQLAVKLYDTPEGVSRELHYSSPNKMFLIEGPIGRGYSFDDFFIGTISIIVGGTGIIPFLDLLAYLYLKTIFSTIKKKTRDEAFETEKDKYEKFLPNATVRLFGSFNKLEDFYMHSIVSEMFLLCQSYKFDHFECKIKLKSKEATPLPMTDRRFDVDFLSEHVVRQSDLVVICGPPEMSKQVFEGLIANGYDKEKILFH